MEEEPRREPQPARRPEPERDGAAPPPPGPHARPDLIDADKTPGTGALPDAEEGGEADPGSG